MEKETKEELVANWQHRIILHLPPLFVGNERMTVIGRILLNIIS